MGAFFFQGTFPPSSLRQRLSKLIAGHPKDTPVSFVEASVGKERVLIPLLGKRL